MGGGGGYKIITRFAMNDDSACVGDAVSDFMLLAPVGALDGRVFRETVGGSIVDDSIIKIASWS